MRRILSISRWPTASNIAATIVVLLIALCMVMLWPKAYHNEVQSPENSVSQYVCVSIFLY
jgi:hypothetical protein